MGAWWVPSPAELQQAVYQYPGSNVRFWRARRARGKGDALQQHLFSISLLSRTAYYLQCHCDA